MPLLLLLLLLLLLPLLLLPLLESIMLSSEPISSFSERVFNPTDLPSRFNTDRGHVCLLYVLCSECFTSLGSPDAGVLRALVCRTGLSSLLSSDITFSPNLCFAQNPGTIGPNLFCYISRTGPFLRASIFFFSIDLT